MNMTRCKRRTTAREKNSALNFKTISVDPRINYMTMTMQGEELGDGAAPEMPRREEKRKHKKNFSLAVVKVSNH
jgi:hypothetical protein